MDASTVNGKKVMQSMRADQTPADGVLQVERAIAEIRAGRPIIIRAGRENALVVSVELFTEDDSSGALKAFIDVRKPGSFARLVLPAPRLRHLGAQRDLAGSIVLPEANVQRICTLSLQLAAKLDAPVAPLTRIDEAGLEIARIAQVLPAVVVVPCLSKDVAANIMRVEMDAIFHFRHYQAARLQIVARAPVPLEGAPITEFVVFRGGEGLRDQVAIIIGKPDFDQPVPVRLHSACLTGDLFGSLKCDCGDQLRQTVQHFAENGCGILLYLDQEGRGNGLSNKMRAYALQTQGYDTYDADAIIGFDQDQRRFDFAAVMLRQIGVRRVELFTNNPQKIAALEAAGLEVVTHTRIIGRSTDENLHYLATKRDRAGHYLDAELALPTRAED